MKTYTTYTTTRFNNPIIGYKLGETTTLSEAYELIASDSGVSMDTVGWHIGPDLETGRHVVCHESGGKYTITEVEAVVSRQRIITMVQAALNAGDSNPDVDPTQWLQDAWDVIQARIKWHLDNGRIRQARAWSDAGYFFATRYDSKFVQY